MKNEVKDEVKVEVKVELNMTKLIDEIKEVIQAFNELVDNLERIEKKYVEQESEDKQ